MFTKNLDSFLINRVNEKHQKAIANRHFRHCLYRRSFSANMSGRVFCIQCSFLFSAINSKAGGSTFKWNSNKTKLLLEDCTAKFQLETRLQFAKKIVQQGSLKSAKHAIQS